MKTLIIERKDDGQIHFYRDQTSKYFKRKTNKETGRLESITPCKDFKNIMMGSKECTKCQYYRWSYSNRVVCKLTGRIAKVFEV